MRRVTIEQVESWGPCQPLYDRAHLLELLAGRPALTVREIAALPIPTCDRLWAILREELIPAAALHELACVYAERPLDRERAAGREPDLRSWEAIRIKRAWLAGQATDEELNTAEAAAWTAARAARAARAAGAAARTARAAGAAARAARAAEAAARAAGAARAAEAAARAAEGAAGAAELTWQLDCAVEAAEAKGEDDVRNT